MTEWRDHVYRVGGPTVSLEEPPSDPERLRTEIEPWLSAVFQSEHLSLLVGNGLTTGVAAVAEGPAVSMASRPLSGTYAERVEVKARALAEASGRGEPNVEDQLRSGLLLLGGLDVLGDSAAAEWRTTLGAILADMTSEVLASERGVAKAVESEKPAGLTARNLLISFLLSFASRAASRDRLHLFTTNYDRLLEYGFDLVGLRPLDRFVGAIRPLFRASRLDVDMHYSPPGIRGEPRYLEGVVRLTKLHGSLDWAFVGGELRKLSLPFGASDDHPAIPRDPLQSFATFRPLCAARTQRSLRTATASVTIT